MRDGLSGNQQRQGECAYKKPKNALWTHPSHVNRIRHEGSQFAVAGIVVSARTAVSGG
jgi:hypothetical protein